MTDVLNANLDEMLEAAAAAGWNACRSSIYAVCEDVQDEYEKHRQDTDSVNRHHFGRGGITAAKSIARGFGAMEAIHDNHFRDALKALSLPITAEPGEDEDDPDAKRIYLAETNRDDWRERATTAEAQLKAAREALEPFAKYLDTMPFDLDSKGNPLPDDTQPGWTYLTAGDFRRARAALSAAAKVRAIREGGVEVPDIKLVLASMLEIRDDAMGFRSDDNERSRIAIEMHNAVQRIHAKLLDHSHLNATQEGK